MDNSRRSFLKKGSLLTLAGMGTQVFSGSLLKAMASNELRLLNEPFVLPSLPYSYDALEPFVDTLTMEIHYSKHHKAYVDNLNKAIAEGKINDTLDELIMNASKYSPIIRNNAGGHWNHSFFWKLMRPEGGGEPSGEIASSINVRYL